MGRAPYYNVTDRSVHALLGALMRKSYVMNNVANDTPVTDETNFNEFLQCAYRTLLTQSRIGLHVDYDNALKSPKLIQYQSEHIINWSPTYIVLREDRLVQDPNDEYEHIVVEGYRELRLNEGLYEVRLWDKVGTKKYVIREVIEPLVRGKRLTFIPFWFVTPFDNSMALYQPMVYPLAELNVHHFRFSVGEAHGLHYLGLPQPWLAGEITGGDPNSTTPKSLAIGTTKAWHLAEGSTVGYLEFSGAGLGAIAAKLGVLEEQMYSSGSRLLTTKRGIESAEALQLRSGSESATLVSLAQALEQGLVKALTFYNEWAGSSAIPELSLNKDFTAAVLDPAQIKALLELHLAGTITLETLLTRLYDGEIVADVETELATLQPAAENAAQV